MTRRTWQGGAVAGLMALVAMAGPAAAEGLRIGYVDMAKVFDQYQRTKDSEAILQNVGKQKQSQLEGQFNELKRLREGLDVLSDQARESKAREIEDKADGFKRQKARTERELVTQRNKVAKQIFEEISTVVTEYAKANQFSVILDQRTVLYGQDTFDVTDEVLQALNSRYASQAKKKAAQ